MIPYISSKIILGFTREFQKNPFDLISQLHQNNGPVFQFRIGPYRPIIILNPDMISHILQNHQNYPKSFLYNDMKKVVGNGLITNEGNSWKAQRKKIQPIFHSEMLNQYSNKIKEIIKSAVDSIKDYKKIDLEKWLTKLSLNIILEVILEIKSKNNEQLLMDINIIIKFIKHQSESLINTPLIVPTKNNKKFKKAYKRFNVEVQKLVQKNINEKSLNILSQLTKVHDNISEPNQLMDEIITLILAGHETIAHSLVWTLCYLSENPNIENELINNVLQDENKSNSIIENIINESLRLKPPVPILTRNVKNTEKIGKYNLKKKDLIIIPIYNFHRIDEYWDNPNQFNLDRWNNPPKNLNKLFIPFASGPRKCIGNRLSYLELEIILTEIYKKIKFKRATTNKIKTNPFITLRPDEKIIMNVQCLN